MPGHEDIPDGCTCEGEVGFYCKKTCFTDNCNDDESLSSIDQVIKYTEPGSNSNKSKEFEECMNNTTTTSTTRTTTTTTSTSTRATTNTTMVQNSATKSPVAAAVLMIFAFL